MLLEVNKEPGQAVVTALLDTEDMWNGKTRGLNVKTIDHVARVVSNTMDMPDLSLKLAQRARGEWPIATCGLLAAAAAKEVAEAEKAAGTDVVQEIV
jgi:hypothetical protein